MKRSVALMTVAAALAVPPHAVADRTVERGGYLVNLLGCSRCHTEGYLTEDAATGPFLAGSRVGIAYTAYGGYGRSVSEDYDEDEGSASGEASHRGGDEAAYVEYGDAPGVVFPSNLTPDDETGLGRWSEDDIVRAMTVGVAKNGHERLMVMPWINYTALTRADVRAIARYLKSLTPVKRSIPEPIAEGDPIDQAYVRFGVYLFEPRRVPGRSP